MATPILTGEKPGNTDSTSPTPTTEPSAVEKPRRVLHEPFAWHRHIALDASRRSAEFAGLVLDVAGGTRDVLTILERDDFDGDFADEHGETLPSLVSNGMAGNLMRLCVTALALLADDADKQLGLLNRHGSAA